MEKRNNYFNGDCGMSHTIIRKLNPSIITSRGDVAYDKDSNEIAYDKDA
jgi:hypothetical protein